MTYQKVTGSLTQGAHPGSYNGQDAYNDMLVTGDDIHDFAQRLSHQGRGGQGLCAVGNGLQGPSDSNGNRGGERENRVRRITPLEAERLQGLPDNWTRVGEFTGTETWKDEDGNEYPVDVYKYRDTDGNLRKVSDSNRFKALGNGICTPFWFWLLKRISAQYERPATLGSFFDGISTFPMLWERLNGPGTTLFVSEIDEFCIAVSREHFGGEVIKDAE